MPRSLPPKTLLSTAALMGALAVAAGAVGSHVLGHDDPVAAHRFETAVQYHQLHALALLALAGVANSGFRRWMPAALLWLAGTLVFCGSLYGLALGGPPSLAKLAPTGGMAMILGWAALLWIRRS